MRANLGLQKSFFSFVKSSAAQLLAQARMPKGAIKIATLTNETAKKTQESLREISAHKSFAPGGCLDCNTRRREGFVVDANSLRCFQVNCMLQRTGRIVHGKWNSCWAFCCRCKMDACGQGKLDAFLFECLKKGRGRQLGSAFPVGVTLRPSRRRPARSRRPRR
jgi:hypothetical protein